DGLEERVLHLVEASETLSRLELALPRLLELLLRALALGDVEHDALPEPGPPVPVANEDSLVVHPHDPAVARPDPVLGVEGLARAVGAPDRLSPLPLVVGVDDLRQEIVVLHPCGRWVSEHRLRLQAE